MNVWLTCLAFGFLAYKDFYIILAFQAFDFQNIWWKFSKKRIVRTNLDIYVFIAINCFHIVT